MKFTKEEKELEILSLKRIGLTDEEIEGFFEFYKDIDLIKPKISGKFIVICSRKKHIK